MRQFIFVQLLVFIFTNVTVFAQSEDYIFNHSKSSGDSQLVYFNVKDIPNDIDEQNRVLEVLLSDENIYQGDFYSADGTDQISCSLEIKNGISVDYVNSIFKSTGYEMDLSDLKRRAAKETPDGVYFSPKYSFFDGFNGLEGYDREKSMEMTSEDYYQLQKTKWVSENPEKYKEIKESDDTLIIIKKKDMQVYTEKKRQYILNHPEKYLIEE